MASLPATAVQRFYQYHAHFYDLTRWMILHGRRRAVDRLELRADSQVLEVGCGTGLNFRLLAERLDAGRGRLVGLDFSHEMLDKARRRVESAGWRNVELLQADAEQMSLGRRFDAIFFSYSIAMIPDWRSALRRAKDHLSPGGRMVVLEFGPFRGWGPLGPVMRAWLRANHVETLNPYADEMRSLFQDCEVHWWMGGYNFTAVGRNEEHA
jgi:ubiquinone/menaquinone biosynthesis C-methylase UbiE